jgi:hypothetical protein
LGPDQVDEGELLDQVIEVLREESGARRCRHGDRVVVRTRAVWQASSVTSRRDSVSLPAPECVQEIARHVLSALPKLDVSARSCG